LLRELDLLPAILPEVVPHADIVGGVLAALAGPTWPAPEPVSFPLGFAAVLHPLPPHAVADIGRRLRLSLAEIDRTAWLVAHRRFPADAPTLPPSRRNPVLVHPGIGELLALAAALGDGAGAAWCGRVLREIPTADLNPPPLLTGDDLRAFGMAPGPRFKPLLDAIRAAQLDGELRDRTAAEVFARNRWEGTR
jgi:poly(A) polymerase